MPKLIVKTQGDEKVYSLPNRPFTIGRAPNSDLTIDHPKSSRKHAQIEPHNGGWRIVDLGSRNGTYVNGSRVESHVLAPGDEVRIANVPMFFEQEPGATSLAKQCPNCFETIPADAAICPHCSEPQRELNLVARCSACGKEQETEGTFCTFCGAELETGMAPPACSNCGKVVPPSAEVCPFCDFSLGPEAEQAPSAHAGSLEPALKVAVGVELVVILALIWMLAGHKAAAPRVKRKKTPPLAAQQTVDPDSVAQKLCAALEEGDPSKLQSYWNAQKPLDLARLVNQWCGAKAQEGKIESCKLIKTTRKKTKATTDLLLALTYKDPNGVAQRTTKPVPFMWNLEDGQWTITSPVAPIKAQEKPAPAEAKAPPPEKEVREPEETEPAAAVPVLPPPPKEDEW